MAVLVLLFFGVIGIVIYDIMPENQYLNTKTLAIAGYVDSQVRLAQFYQKGVFTAPRDDSKAIYWFKTAAQSGSKLAEDLLQDGYGIKYNKYGG